MTINVDQEVRLRPFNRSLEDYTALVAIARAVFPDDHDTVEEIQHWDASRPTHCVQRRWLVEIGDTIIGAAEYFQPQWMYHPRKFFISIAVHPDWQGRGIGKYCYDILMADLQQQYQVEQIRANCREDYPRSLTFLDRRGFREEMRTWESRLDLRLFDPMLFAEAIHRVVDQGFTICNLNELLATVITPDSREADFYIRIIVNRFQRTDANNVPIVQRCKTPFPQYTTLRLIELTPLFVCWNRDRKTCR